MQRLITLLESEMQVSVAKYMLLLALVLAALPALAHDVAPEALLQAVSVKVIDRIKEDQARRAVNRGMSRSGRDHDYAPVRFRRNDPACHGAKLAPGHPISSVCSPRSSRRCWCGLIPQRSRITAANSSISGNCAPHDSIPG
jgi:hypothetical protein